MSVVFQIYNSNFERIRKSLLSIVGQKNIRFEIVVADDGSDYNHKKELEEFFRERAFKDYKLILNRENQGTVRNHLSAIQVCEGEYTKALSPGDCFFDDSVLREWVDFTRNAGCSWAFAEAVYYRNKNGEDEIVRVPANPHDLRTYIFGSKERFMWHYIVLSDLILGVLFLCRTELEMEYLGRIASVNVKYADDNVWRLMVFDGITGKYFQRVTVLYEYGSGVSTSGSDLWRKRLEEDWNRTNEIMSASENLTDYQRKMLKKIQQPQRMLSKLFTKGKLKHCLSMRWKRRMTPVLQAGGSTNAGN